MLSPYRFWCRPNFICNARMRICKLSRPAFPREATATGAGTLPKRDFRLTSGRQVRESPGSARGFGKNDSPPTLFSLLSDTLAVAMSTGETGHWRIGVRAVPPGVWALGFVSLFMDISSEMIHGLLPVFLTSVLGASAQMVGLIEGVGEATASMSKLLSGWISDKLGRRKMLTVLGYALGALSKPLFAIASTAPLVLAARFSDRVGKGIRGAPRDAMVGDMVPAGQRGAAYGLRQTLDTIGAFSGPLLAMLLMAGFHNNFRLIFWLALIPGLISVLVLIFGVAEPPHQAADGQRPSDYTIW